MESMKILLATDGSDSSLAALNAVAERPWPAGSEVKIISVVEAHLPPAPVDALVPDSYYLKRLAEQQTAARDAIAAAETQLRATNGDRTDPIEIVSEIINGSARESIVEEAVRWKADLIVVGSHGHRGVKRFWLGSVSLAVANHANCSVEIVRSEGELGAP